MLLQSTHISRTRIWLAFSVEGGLSNIFGEYTICLFRSVTYCKISLFLHSLLQGAQFYFYSLSPSWLRSRKPSPRFDDTHIGLGIWFKLSYNSFLICVFFCRCQDSFWHTEGHDLRSSCLPWPPVSSISLSLSDSCLSMTAAVGLGLGGNPQKRMTSSSSERPPPLLSPRNVNNNRRQGI